MGGLCSPPFARDNGECGSFPAARSSTRVLGGKPSANPGLRGFTLRRSCRVQEIRTGFPVLSRGAILEPIPGAQLESRVEEKEHSMAQRVNVVLVDDIDGSDATETVTFGLDGVQYEIDLSEGHADELRQAMALYIGHGR